MSEMTMTETERDEKEERTYLRAIDVFENAVERYLRACKSFYQQQPMSTQKQLEDVLIRILWNNKIDGLHLDTVATVRVAEALSKNAVVAAIVHSTQPVA